MKRLFSLSAAVALLAGLSASHLVWSAPPPGNKVLVCHASESDDGVISGKVISISVNALPAHVRHGDCLIGPSTPADRALVGTPCDPTPVSDVEPIDSTCATLPTVE